jgi:FMN phosphatase YigB (HAD superfamily)
MQPYDNVIVVDADGVLLYYEHAFHMWMVSKGYTVTETGFYNIHEKYSISKEESKQLVETFNHSAALSRLPPVRDAIKYVRKLHEEYGYVFHCITAIPNTVDTYNARMKNIENLFGKTAFERLTLCDHSENKKELLKEYKDTGCYWIEDLHENLKYGVDLGMKGILMDHHYNRFERNDFEYKRVYNWKEIYKEIVGID